MNNSNLCRKQSTSDILLKFFIWLILIWIFVIIIQEYSGISLESSIMTIEMILISIIPIGLLILLISIKKAKIQHIRSFKKNQ